MVIDLHAPAPGQLAAIQTALAAAGLPNLDLTTAHLDNFLVADGVDGSVTHCVGVEVFGQAGLLRSLAVTAGARGQGQGVSLLDAAERLAAAQGVATLYLLTTTARPFFERAGYATCAPRDAVPSAVRATTEFTTLCPASATCMSKAIDPPEPTT